MEPNISEFSYGYAITEELIHWHSTKLTAAPVFPSLYQEGQRGGGWDVMLKRPGIPLFLQFKLSHCMVRANAEESRKGILTNPFYRMYLRPPKHSKQHEMLLDLESAGNEVYYSAPVFHEPWELNQAYLNHQVKNQSIWVRPSWIGPLPDDEEHYVAFKHPGQKHFCSESRPLKDNVDFKDFADNLVAVVREKGKYELGEQRLSQVADKLADIARKRTDIPPQIYETSRIDVQGRIPLERIAFYSHMFLDTQLFIVIERGES